MVAFIDPRHSRIDIAQATGRAMRKPDGSGKEVGYVVVPMFLERKNEETLQQALERSDFADVANVLTAMQEQDEDLIQIIRELKEAASRQEIFDPRRLSEKVEVLGPSVELSTLRSNIFAEIVGAIGVSWDEWYGRLQSYKNQFGDCRVPQKYKTADGYRLGGWVSEQRHKPDAILPERKARLDSLGFDWNPFKTDWEKGFEHLTAYVKEYKDYRISPRYRSPDGYRLGGWVLEQRQSRDKLSTERRLRLESLGFDWDPVTTRFKEGFERLRDYVRQHGHCRVPLRYKSSDGYSLGRWVGDRRELQNTISPNEREELNSLGFIWNVHEDAWQQGFEHLTAYVKEYKHCRVPVQYKTSGGYDLGRWVHVQRTAQDELSVERKSRLDALDFVWDLEAAQWETSFDHLQEYVRVHKHCRVPQQYKSPDGFALGMWVSNQRQRRSSCSNERIARLDALGFIWNTRPAGAEKASGNGYA
jgi:hypothetical protein